MPVGSSAHVAWGLRESAALAISGETVLLRDGHVTASDDSILHPRTSVGIDRERDRILILVVDGRSGVSRGATLVEMAQLLKGLGADDALNFDGGGSSTMVAPNRKGAIGVRNQPSDGAPRSVGDALVVRYRPPS
jgi:exopolysaccharide biosynthesis protein